MAITDLTGTSWYINNNPTAASNIDYYHITFESRGTTFALITINDSASIVYDETDAYYFGDGWRYQMYRAITISGGDDVASQGLISWLEANAVQIEVDTLVNTSWIINDVPETMVGRAQYGQGTNLTFNIVGSDTEYSNFTWLSSSKLSYRIGPAVDQNYLDVYNNGTWVSNDYRIITITGGSDATLNFDRGWFQTNAVPYVKPIEYIDKVVLASGDGYYLKDSISGYIAESDLVAGNDIQISATSEGVSISRVNGSQIKFRFIRYPKPTITNLTGTTWLFNSTLDLSGYPSSSNIDHYDTDGTHYNINYTVTGTASVTGFATDNFADGFYLFSSRPTQDSSVYRSQIIYGYSNTDSLTVWPYNYYSEGWFDDVFRTIVITGGSDATNQEFISWLRANATQVS